MGGTLADLDRLNIERPTLVLDRERALRNIERMAGRARSSGVLLRPHFKTHQSRAVGRWFRDAGTEAIAVSSVQMARYFADDGWSDITIAFPLNRRELRDIAELAERVRLGLLVDSVDAVTALRQGVAAPTRVWIKVDTGCGRAGVAWDDEAGLSALAGALRSAGGHEPAGVLTHNGSTYRERTRDGVLRAHAEAMSRLSAAVNVVSGASGAACDVSIGDTPSASLVDDLDGADEIRPGNFVFNDLMQMATGSCTPDDIAVAVACPVVSVYKDRREALLYGGAVHLSLDSIYDESGRTVFGQVSHGWPETATTDAPVVSVSQEHGIVSLSGDDRRLSPGDVACVLPVHSCLTCNLYHEYVTLDGEKLPTINGACGL